MAGDPLGAVELPVKEVIWNSESGRIRISFNQAAPVRYSEQLFPARGRHECL